jgi:aminoacylase
VKVTAKGNTGHSLIIHENTAAEKIQQVINRMLEVRTKEKKRLESNPDLGLGDVTTINLTKMEVSMVQ